MPTCRAARKFSRLHPATQAEEQPLAPPDQQLQEEAEEPPASPLGPLQQHPPPPSGPSDLRALFAQALAVEGVA